jgi:murein DD-endopeptidase MepM/ murein hydrolase activator NlpD
MIRPIKAYTRITSYHGQPTGMGVYGKHLGCDYAAPTGTPIYAPVSGKITKSLYSSTIGNYYELVENGNGRIHRLLHLNSRPLGAGALVTEGQNIGLSGNSGITTGPHLHWDIRKANTLWNSSFYNFYDPEALLAAQIPINKMPAIGSLIQLIPTIVRKTYRAGTTTVVGVINVTDYSFVYMVRGYDPVYPYRILINSASAGGNNVGLALYYTDGSTIGGWKKL